MTDFSEMLLDYYKGERAEAVLLAVLGVFLWVACWLVWRHMPTNAMLKGLFYPLVLLALTGLLAGAFNAWNNHQRLQKMSRAYQEDPQAFVGQEVARFEGKGGVNAWWVPLKITWTICLLLGLLLSYLKPHGFVHGVALGLILWGCFGLMVDGFAHQRARVYTAQLLQQ
jgi:hypothetical protein